MAGECVGLDLLDPGSGLSKGCGGSAASSTIEPALSVISDSLSEQEYSSDSGKGGSGSDTVTPPQSVATEVEEVPAGVDAGSLQVCASYNAYTAYSESLGRIFPDHAMIYEFEIPPFLVGRLIGRHGSYIIHIKELTGANIIVKRHYQSGRLKICAVEGVCSEIDNALAMIRQRFPAKTFPEVTMAQLNYDSQITPVSFLPSNNKLNLIEGVVNDVAVSCVVSLDHIFVQQPTHPTFPALSSLHITMKSLYDEPDVAPKLLRPFSPGVICVVKLKEDWFRCEVVAIQEEKDQATARLVDVGGYVQLLIDLLRQIRMDFVTIPFQATECRLANVVPVNEEEGWSEEAVNFFKILAQGHVLQATVICYSAKDNTTLIHLYKLDGNHSHIFINQELVNHGYAKWIEEPEIYVFTDVDELCQNFTDLGTVSPSAASSIDTTLSTTSWGDISSSDELTPHEAYMDTNSSFPKSSEVGHDASSVS